MDGPLFGFEWNEAQPSRDSENALISIVARDKNGAFRAVGGGFVVKSSGKSALAVSAAHVFAEIYQLKNPRTLKSHSTALREFLPEKGPIDLDLGGLAALAFRNGAPVMSKFEGLFLDEACEVGAACLRPQNVDKDKYPLGEFILDDEWPRIGGLVCTLAYADLSCESIGGAGFRLARRPIMRFGRVLETFPSGQRLCRGPCFTTSIPILHGMSGCPVFHFDTSGPMRVVGVVCSDLDDDDNPAKFDRSVSGCSVIAMLPVKRLSGSATANQEVTLSFVPTYGVGSFPSI